MTRRLLAALVAGALFAAATPLRAQLRSSISLAGGLSAPVGTLAERVDAGYHAAVALNLAAPLTPLGLRFEAGVNGFSGRTNGLVTFTDHRIFTGTANATIALGALGASPYLIGGVGVYNRQFVADGGTGSDRSSSGVNGGAGIHFPLGTLSSFIEARYHHMLGNAADGTNYRFVPVTFGISF